MSFFKRVAPTALMLLALAQPAWAQQAAAGADDKSALEWLDQLAESAATLSYQGVVAYAQGSDELESLRLTHGQAGGQLYERLEYLDDAEREVVRDGNQLTSGKVGSSRVAHAVPGQRLWAQGADALADHYDISVIGSGRVAGRPTVELALVPFDEHRFGYYLSLDRETGLLLRSETVDSERRVLEQFQFATIDIRPQLKDEWIVGSIQPVSATDARGSAAGGDWQPTWVPAGFELTARPTERRAMSTYSDGLAAFSVIVQPQPDADHGAGRARRGATVAYTRPAMGGDEEVFTVTVIGEIPVVTAQRVAESVVLNAGSSSSS